MEVSMKRREFVASVLASGLAVPVMADDDHGHDHDRRRIEGTQSIATVSFGQWTLNSTVPGGLDRFSNPTSGAGNGHHVIPFFVRIKAGGAVNFAIAGLHQVIVYGPDVRPDDINVDLVVPGSTPPLIDDPAHRLYRGVDPRTQPRDRVEVVQFPDRGLYLVICGVRPHFVNEDMFGYVRVVK
jgi:hypothetical protein